MDIPHALGLLPNAAVTKYLGRSVQSGQESPPQVALRKMTTHLPDTEARRRTAPVRELIDEAMRRHQDDRVGADAWLAPRLHATVRLTRAEAADDRLWNHLAMLVAPDYVVWRHRSPSEGVAPASRFSGPHYTQAFSRLWWAAELFRNGADYRPVETACRLQDVLNTTLRLDVVDHRPTALAIVRVVRRLLDEGVSKPGDRVNALSAAVNTAGSTLVYDALAPDTPYDQEALRDWIDESADMPPVPWDRLPDGPQEGAIPDQTVESLVKLFEALLAEAPLRRRSPGPQTEAS
ncbi:DUF6339 family protein [Streptomyces capparidis]